MRRVYQRHPALALLAGLLSFPLACGGEQPAATPTARAATPVAASEPSLILATRHYALATLRASIGDDLLATERSSAGRRAVWLSSRAPGEVRPLTSPEHDCIAVAVLRESAAIVECAGGDRRALWRFDAAGRGEALPLPVGAGRESPLALTDGPPTLWSTTGEIAADPARLLATELLAFGRRGVFTAPAGYAIAAVDPGSSRALLRRELTADADEIVLHDWSHRESRLLLPTAADGRFTELHFVEHGQAALLLADDATGTVRLERIDLVSGARSVWGDLPCPPRHLDPHVGGELTVAIDCDGHRRALRLDAHGAPLPRPALPSGIRPIDFEPASDGWAVATVGARWPAELALADGRGDFHPLTYGLPARWRHDAIPTPRRESVASAGVALPAELWPAAGPPRAIAIWFERGELPARFGELRPLTAALAARGVAVLIVRGRGSESPVRAFRRAADGDPATNALVDLRSAATAASRLVPPGVPRLLFGDGPWWGAAALALAASAEPAYDSVYALFPDLDPLAGGVAPASAGEPRPGVRVARWGAADAAAAERRRAWSAAAERVRVPSWIAIDPRRPGAVEAMARWQAAAVAGVSVQTFAFDEPRDAEHPSAVLAEAIVQATESRLAGLPR